MSRGFLESLVMIKPSVERRGNFAEYGFQSTSLAHRAIRASVRALKTEPRHAENMVETSLVSMGKAGFF